MKRTPYTPQLFDSPEESESYLKTLIRYAGIFPSLSEACFRGGKFLHLFCEEGHYLRCFGEASPQWELYGIDGSPEAIDKAKNNCPSAQFLQQVCPPLPYPDNYFNFVYHQTIFDYSDYRAIDTVDIPITFKLDDMVSEIFRVTASGGLYCVFDYLRAREEQKIVSTGFEKMDSRFFKKPQ